MLHILLIWLHHFSTLSIFGLKNKLKKHYCLTDLRKESQPSESYDHQHRIQQHAGFAFWENNLNTTGTMNKWEGAIKRKMVQFNSFQEYSILPTASYQIWCNIFVNSQWAFYTLRQWQQGYHLNCHGCHSSNIWATNWKSSNFAFGEFSLHRHVFLLALCKCQHPATHSYSC